MNGILTFLFLISACIVSAQNTAPPKRDGKIYKTINIGSQVWMADNLNIVIKESWCYNNDPAMCKKYGRLYDWATAMKACPRGFHLPSDIEWDQLMLFLGGQKTAGNEMKSTSGWLYNGNGNNSSDFNALPGGHRNTDTKFFDVGIDCYYWTSTEAGSQAWYRGLYNEDGKIGKYLNSKGTGMYVRCIKD